MTRCHGEVCILVFREPAAPVRPASRVVHGPFPVRWPVAGTAIMCAIVGVAMTLFGLSSEHLACGVEGTCTIDDRPVFTRSELHGAHAVIETGSKNTKYGVVTLDFANGKTRRLMRVTPSEANEAVEEIRASVNAGAPIDVTIH